uniref:NADH dehydrogenase subunit 4 n=1 Tax=Mylabris quadripunctata TaxID=268458 RepID=UPI001FA6D491|nr:NADH dehydrogenase subunit 4 [Mylabris quadripunctata]UMR54920.1 NADH dehydrogenase subunit 4 [Mylabris quadripunctata]
MMKFILMLFMMMPLVFLNYFWLLQFMWMLMTFFFILMFSFNYMYMYISYFFGVDLISYLMIMLSFWVCSLMILASQKIYYTNFWSRFFMFVVVCLMLSLFLAFASMNLFVFYIFFEVSLIPTLMLIVGWGYQPERLQAGIYMLFYTVFASLPMMIAIFYYYKFNGSLDFNCLKLELNEMVLYLCMNMVFFIKIPLFFVHLWLPKAHVEAPVSGSMILAGVMLKLGGYGLMRMMVVFLGLGLTINYFFIGLSLVGGVMVSLICLRQSDIKSLIAYSSVAHMGLTVSGILTLNFWGMSGALMMMIAHGLCSSGLFCLANLSYERTGSRSLYMNKGMINIIPSLSLWWFLFTSSNMAAPPSLNLMGEIMLINSLLSYEFTSMVAMMLLSFFGAVYSLYLYSFSQHGKIYSGLYAFPAGNFREYLLLLLHWLPLNVLILKGELMCLWL